MVYGILTAPETSDILEHMATVPYGSALQFSVTSCFIEDGTPGKEGFQGPEGNSWNVDDLSYSIIVAKKNSKYRAYFTN